MIKMLMPMSTHECVAPSSGLIVSPSADHSSKVASLEGTGLPVVGWFSDRDQTFRISGVSGEVSFFGLPMTQRTYTDLSTQLVPTDPRTAVRNGNPGLRTWSPPV